MANSQRPDFDRMLDWIEDRLPPEEAENMAERVASNESARADAEWLRAFARVSGETIIGSPPAEVREELRRRFEAFAGERRAEERSRPGIMRRVLAALSFDSGMQPALGVRSAGCSEAQRQFIYSTDLADIALNLQPRPGGKLDLLGQILADGDEDPEGFTVQLLRKGVEAGIADADDLGEFAFEEIEPGRYEIIISAGRFEILIPPFDLR